MPLLAWPGRSYPLSLMAQSMWPQDSLLALSRPTHWLGTDRFLIQGTRVWARSTHTFSLQHSHVVGTRLPVSLGCHPCRTGPQRRLRAPNLVDPGLGHSSHSEQKPGIRPWGQSLRVGLAPERIFTLPIGPSDKREAPALDARTETLTVRNGRGRGKEYVCHWFCVKGKAF